MDLVGCGLLLPDDVDDDMDHVCYEPEGHAGDDHRCWCGMTWENARVRKGRGK